MNEALDDLLFVGRLGSPGYKLGLELARGRHEQRYRVCRAQITDAGRDINLKRHKLTAYVVMDTLGMGRFDLGRFNFARHDAPQLFFSMNGPAAEAACRALNTDVPHARYDQSGLVVTSAEHEEPSA